MWNGDIISMPDKWEYPWYAAWDLAFHALPLAMVDVDFAKQQLALMLRNDYLHPNGQLPAYEWNFGDVNPPVHAWATMNMYLLEQREPRRRAATSSSSSRRSRSCCSTSPGGSIARTAPAPTSSRAASSASTTSASSTARRRCPPAATSTRPTARPGWSSTASRCCASRSSSRCTTRPTRSSSTSSSSTRCCIAGAMDRVGEQPRRDVGRGGRLLLRRPALPGRQRPRASRCGRSSGSCRWRPSRSSRRTSSRGCRPSASTPAVLRRAIPSWSRTCTCPGRRGRQPPDAVDRRRGQAPPHSRPDARRERVLRPLRNPRSVPLPPRPSRTFSNTADRSIASPTSRATRTAACSAATRTGADLSGCRSTRCCTAPCSGSTPTTATSSRWSARRARGG